MSDKIYSGIVFNTTQMQRLVVEVEKIDAFREEYGSVDAEDLDDLITLLKEKIEEAEIRTPSTRARA